jgi:uncharacterized protein (TIGR01777 family)
MPAAEPASHRALRVAVSGASGLIGTALSVALERDGHAVLPLVRARTAGPGEIAWEPEAGRIDAAALEGLDAVVHLAGENVAQRWTSRVRERILQSRVRGTRLLADTLASLRRPPEVLVSASAVGYYGDRGDELLDESSTPGNDFLAGVAEAWEGAAKPAAEAGIRVAHPRFGVVLSPAGGALKRMLPAFRLGAGGRVGSGRQWMSWIALDDAVDALRFVIDTPGLAGPIDFTAPEPVTNEEFTRVLSRVLGRPAFLEIPAVALRLLFGEMADRTLLASQRARPTRLLGAGFSFRHPSLEDALTALLAAQTADHA